MSGRQLECVGGPLDGQRADPADACRDLYDAGEYAIARDDRRRRGVVDGPLTFRAPVLRWRAKPADWQQPGGDAMDFSDGEGRE